MKDNNNSSRNATPPDLISRTVQILNIKTQLWEIVTLVRGLYYMSGNRYAPGWADRTGNVYTPEQLKAMHQAGVLRYIKPLKAWDKILIFDFLHGKAKHEDTRKAILDAFQELYAERLAERA